MHRYPDRVLLKLTPICAVYCRFCFRREMVGPDKANALSAATLEAALDYIRGASGNLGGDPHRRRSAGAVRAPSARCDESFGRYRSRQGRAHHTRVPIADPARITPDLVRALKIKGKSDLRRCPRQSCARIDGTGARRLRAHGRRGGCRCWRRRCCSPGVNDTAETMSELMRALVECRIKPYYLHPRRPGAGHKSSAHRHRNRGQELMRQLRGRLSGLCQPAYVLDIPGGHGKSPIGPNYIERLPGE